MWYKPNPRTHKYWRLGRKLLCPGDPGAQGWCTRGKQDTQPQKLCLHFLTTNKVDYLFENACTVLSIALEYQQKAEKLVAFFRLVHYPWPPPPFPPFAERYFIVFHYLSRLRTWAHVSYCFFLFISHYFSFSFPVKFSFERSSPGVSMPWHFHHHSLKRRIN